MAKGSQNGQTYSNFFVTNIQLKSILYANPLRHPFQPNPLLAQSRNISIVSLCVCVCKGKKTSEIVHPHRDKIQFQLECIFH